MKVGLYFGSFNPIHHGHLIIANYMLQNSDLDQIWLVVSPQNPFKQSASLLSAYNRFNLVQLAVEAEPKLKASDIEFKLPQPSYTVNTLAYLQEKYPTHQFAIIMGSDSFENLAKWKNYEFILHHYPIFVYRRPGHDVVNNFKEGTITILDAPLLQISATHIRNCIRQGKSIRYLVPDKVLEEIQQNRYYL
ncbi:nicotinate (nicotinamide) nucleotide adenylyltransferase [Niastella populi]|uniref:Probable nicotinate-nucleotide adenylyltransferase n=1 Tax=Niastella populi TaxID=550983 RepID=A0A1V9FTK9_9BACT|nr:nicotinate (nicotinamide) nucleotide adenylyltransferase [Niastella populi]OQP61673.1 nicotinic acid mononucleotide adenylyltransferase [Niastella populi]